MYEWLLVIMITGNGSLFTDNVRLQTEQECQVVGSMYRKHYADERKVTTSCVKVLEKKMKKDNK